jgi:hypothetical protein
MRMSDGDRDRDRVGDEVETLQTIRDELRLQVHLGRAEARERWQRLEKDWEHLEAKMKVLREGSQESLDDIGRAARGLVREIREGYHHIRDLI